MLVRAAIVMWWIGAAFFFVAVCASTELIPLGLLFAVMWLACWGVTFILGGTFSRAPPLPSDVANQSAVADEVSTPEPGKAESDGGKRPVERAAPRRQRARSPLH